MNGQTSEALLSLFDSARLRPRYWINFSLLSLITVLEFFDFAIVAFLLAVLGPQWHLTYGQSAIILYSGGVGAICGAVAWGSLSDAWGRKSQLGTGHIHMRHRRGCDRPGAAGCLGRACHVALRRRLRPDSGGDALSHTRRRDHPDALPHGGVQLLRRVRHRRRAAGFGDLGDIADIAGLARCRDAGGGDHTGRHRDRAGGSGVGTMAYRQGTLR